MKKNSIYKNTTLLLMVAIMATAFSVTPAEARTVLRSGDSVSIAEDQIVEGDFYTAGSKISISGEIKEDIVSAGGETTINGTVGGDAFLTGGRVDVHGKIGDDLRILAGEVTIAEPVAGDIFVIGGSVNILSTATVAGDVIIFGGEAVIEGTVEGDVIGMMGTLRIDAPVKGDVDVTVEQLTLGDNAVIDGGVSYVSDVVLVQSLNATVAGDVMRSDTLVEEDGNGWNSLVVFALVLLFSVLVWYLVARKTLQSVVSRISDHGVRSVLIGFATLIFAPVAFSVLMVSVIGSVVGFIAFLIYLIALVLSVVGATAVLGALSLLIGKKKSVPTVNLVSLVLGVLVFCLLILVPVIGPLVITCSILLTFGALIDALIGKTK